jgi:hypothetical protein
MAHTPNRGTPLVDESISSVTSNHTLVQEVTQTFSPTSGGVLTEKDTGRKTYPITDKERKATNNEPRPSFHPGIVVEEGQIALICYQCVGSPVTCSTTRKSKRGMLVA